MANLNDTIINGNIVVTDKIIKSGGTASDILMADGSLGKIQVTSSGNGNVITGISASGNTITYTKGDISSKYVYSDVDNLKIQYNGSLSSTKWLCAWSGDKSDLIQGISPSNLPFSLCKKNGTKKNFNFSVDRSTLNITTS